MRLGGKVAIVTGGARHIGAAYCRRLAAEGAAVVIADVLDGESVVKEIAAAGWQGHSFEGRCFSGRRYRADGGGSVAGVWPDRHSGQQRGDFPQHPTPSVL